MVPLSPRTGDRLRLLLLAALVVSLLATACGTATPAPTGTAAAPAGETVVPTAPASTGEKRQLTVWTYQPADDPAIDALIKAFEAKYPDIQIAYTPLPEDEYQTKVNTALTAHQPPDVAIIENKGWMQAGRVVELTEQLKLWGVDPRDFNPGGVGRITISGDINAGIYGIGDFVGGNVLFYNKDMFDAAGLTYPVADRSLAWPEYADLCRQLGKPSRNPEEAVYGCSVPDWSFGIWTRWLYGKDGREAIDNMNSAAMVEAWNLGTALVRDGYAPSGSVMEAFPAGESDMFAQKKIAMTWSDFTEATKYKEQGVSFGVAPFWVISGSESFVDTWTAPWGTFTESKNRDDALLFLQFVATDGQRIRAEVTSDPPFSTKVARELNWGEGDSLLQQYLQVLQAAKPQVFVPPLPEDAYNAAEIYRLLTVEGQTDAKPLLDSEAEKTQPLLEQAWQDWDKLAQR